MTLSAGAVHVHELTFGDCDGLATAAARVLSPEERRRAADLTAAPLRRRFELSHAFVRWVLAIYVDGDPATIDIGVANSGKPELIAAKTGPSSPAFNLAHCDSHALVAVTMAPAVGVDVERNRPGLDIRGIARRHFAAEEAKALEALDDEAAHDWFLRLWTYKEAFAKAIGLGLSLPFDQVVAGGLGTPTPSLRIVPPEHGSAALWSLWQWRVAPGIQASAVARGTARQLTRHDDSGRFAAFLADASPVTATPHPQEEATRQ